MKRRSILLCLLLLCLSASARQKSADARFKMWYDAPATEFIESLVMGNGSMGAIIYGGVSEELINLNESTLWSGEPTTSTIDPEQAKRTLAAIRKALDEGNYYEADKLQHQLQGNFSQVYLPMAGLHIAFEGDTVASNYRRELDLSKAITTVDYNIGKTKYNRTYFVSYPDKVLAVELTAKGGDAINGEISLDSKLRYTTSAANGVLQAEGYAPYNISFRTKKISWDKNRGIRFTLFVKPIEYDGTVECRDGKVVVKDCKRVVLLVTSATSFNGYDKDPAKEGRDNKMLAHRQLAAAEKHSFAELKERHIADYTKYFNRVDIEFDGKDKSHIPTDKRLKAYTDGAEDRALEALYLHFSRYLIISASRTENVPMNLQGIWNEKLLPPWNSNYTVNINTEENYWGVEMFNLSEFHQPLLSFLSQLAKSGEKTARDYYGCGGWCACHNSDLWAMTNPVGEGKGRPYWANWNMGGAWLATHLWEHYLYTLDKEYLAKYAYPLLKGASQFLLDWVVEDKHTGYILTSPSTSPENSFNVPGKGRRIATSYGATSDLAIIRELLSATWCAAEELRVDAELQGNIHAVLEQLYPYQIGKRGNLQEWYHDFEEYEPTHRHLSHLIGLFPGSHISPEKSPELAAAAKRSIDLRGRHSTGWSTGWRIGLYARLCEAEAAYERYRLLLTYTRALNTKVKARGVIGGTYPNLLDAHPPFQIDANFAAPAGVAELLVQSQFGSIDLLPALPKAWAKGSFRGLRARGAFEVDLRWRKGEVDRGSILSLAGSECILRSHTPLKIKGVKATTEKVGDWYVVKFPTEKSKRYEFVVK